MSVGSISNLDHFYFLFDLLNFFGVFNRFKRLGKTIVIVVRRKSKADLLTR